MKDDGTKENDEEDEEDEDDEDDEEEKEEDEEDRGDERMGKMRTVRKHMKLAGWLAGWHKEKDSVCVQKESLCLRVEW